MSTEKIKKKVQVVVLFQNKVLLLKLAENRGGFWQNITGGVDAGEDFLVAAKRELMEETGILGEVEYIPLDFEFDDRFGFHVIEKVYFCRLLAEPKIQLSEEHQSFKWLDLNHVTPDDYKYPTNFAPINWLKKK